MCQATDVTAVTTSTSTESERQDEMQNEDNDELWALDTEQDEVIIGDSVEETMIEVNSDSE